MRFRLTEVAACTGEVWTAGNVDVPQAATFSRPTMDRTAIVLLNQFLLLMRLHRLLVVCIVQP